MSTQRLAYDDASTPAEMNADCLAAQSALVRPLRTAAAGLSKEQPKQAGLQVPDAAARLATAIYGE